MLKMKNEDKNKYYKNLERAMDTLGILTKDTNVQKNKQLLDGIEALDEELQELWSSDKRKEIPKKNYIYYVDLMKQTKDLEKLTTNKSIIANLKLVYRRLEMNKDMLL